MKQSTTYRVSAPVFSAGVPPPCPATWLVTATLKGGRTVSGSETIGCGTVSGFPTASTGNVFPRGANM
jgi:hypothetical protein